MARNGVVGEGREGRTGIKGAERDRKKSRVNFYCLVGLYFQKFLKSRIGQLISLAVHKKSFKILLKEERALDDTCP
jgi:hypothetical protein